MNSRPITAYYVASTHWDREWYEPFQGFRYYLVEVLDEVYDTLERDPRFACFQMDGQVIPIEDYLEIRPERREQTRRLAAAGRLRLGPWYTLPDEFIVGPESLIRNLEEGFRVARELGHLSRAGFVCDLFGHVSQLPQIFRGFGIETAYTFRGGNEDTHGGAYRWQAPDGSEVVAHRFGPREGYFDYGAQVRGAWQADAQFEPAAVAARLADYVRMQRDRVGVDSAVLLFDGGDHMTIEPRTPDMLAAFHELQSEIEVRFTGLDEYSAALVAARDRIARRFVGEQRHPGRLHWDGTWVIPGVYSSRIRLKQDNRRREAELCQWAEPFSHLAAQLTGRAYPHSYLRIAWRYLLQNHAHDSICGCSPDQVHKDMEYRFDQARLINSKVIDAALRAVAQRVQLPDLEGEQFALVVFNPTQADLAGPVDLELWFDHKTPSLFGEFFKYEWKVGFRLYDADGREVPYDYVRWEPQRRRFHRPRGKVPVGQECIVVHITAPLRIPALGYTTLLVKPEAAVTRHPAGRLLVNARTLENQHLRVTVQCDGSLTLLDKRTGQTYSRLNVFEERADIGDGWYHGVAVNDEIFTSTAAAADVAVVAAGAQAATLRVTTRLEVPERFEFDPTKMQRSRRRVPLVLDSDVTLRAGADHVEIRTTVDNQVRDHRVRALFDTGAAATHALFDSAFDVVARPIALPPDNHTYKELAVETAPQASWTAVHDAQRGLAIIAPHQPESAVLDVPERTIALTLFRGFRRTIFTDGEEGGQSLGPLEFLYRIVPLAGPPDPAHLARIAQAMAGGIRAVQVLPRDQAPAAQRTLPPLFGQLTLTPGRAVLTSFRRAPDRDTLELRLFNPRSEPLTEVLTVRPAAAAAHLVDFDRNRLGDLPVDRDGRITLALPPHKIVTVAISQTSGS